MPSLNPDQFKSPEQLKLFMSGTEWQASVHASTDAGKDSMHEVWAYKEAEAREPAEHKVRDVRWVGGQGKRVTIASRLNSTHGAGTYDSIKEHGFNPSMADAWDDPPTIILQRESNIKTQWHGHHRVAAAAAVERDTGKPVYIPTNYDIW